MKTAAVIFVGGKARRLSGIEKQDITIGGVSCLQRIVSRLSGNVDDIFLSNKAKKNTTDEMSKYSVIYDEVDITKRDGAKLDGVLNALVTVMKWGMTTEYDFIITTTADTPFLPPHFAPTLHAAFRSADNKVAPAVSVSGGRVQGLHALWPRASWPSVIHYMGNTRHIDNTQRPSMRQLHEHLNSVQNVFSVSTFDPFFNINTPAQLQKAQSIADMYNA